MLQLGIGSVSGQKEFIAPEGQRKDNFNGCRASSAKSSLEDD
jgi:hypothetical protein